MEEFVIPSCRVFPFSLLLLLLNSLTYCLFIFEIDFVIQHFNLKPRFLNYDCLFNFNVGWQVFPKNVIFKYSERN